MTEAGWFVTEDLEHAVRWLSSRPGDRKLLLFGCACLRQLGELLPWELQECVKYTEKLADGLLRRNEFAARITSRTLRPEPGSFDEWLTRDMLIRLYDLAYLTAPAPEVAAQSAALLRRFRHTPEVAPRRIRELLRDIVGNPFRPVAFDPNWRTSTAVALAKRVYESRDFSIMPILADALQDAGCDTDDILTHCRAPHGVHVRGCWVVDLVLGKA